MVGSEEAITPAGLTRSLADWHLGHFARDNRAPFGGLPFGTLAAE